MIVNEHKTSFLEVSFTDKDGLPVIPDSATYRVDCLTTGAVIKGSTVISSLASTIEIVISADENAIQDPCNKYEKRKVTVSAVYDIDKNIDDDYTYTLKNLDFVG